MLQQNFNIDQHFNPIVLDKDTNDEEAVIDPIDCVVIIPHSAKKIHECINQLGGKRFFYGNDAEDAAKDYAYILSLEKEQIPTGNIEGPHEKIEILKGIDQIMAFARAKFTSITEFYKKLAQLYTEANFSESKMREYFSSGIPENNVYCEPRRAKRWRGDRVAIKVKSV